ncbi:MAG: aldo/keto reductase [Methyloligellaceae bacterium]
MDPLSLNRIGETGLEVTALGFGGGTLGDPDEVIGEDQAEATLAAAHDAGIRYFDTAPWYGNTKSEHRLGHFLRTRPRASFALSTKVGRIYARPDDIEAFKRSPWAARWVGGLPFDLRFDYSGDGVRRSYEDSLMRLGLNGVDALAIHDLDLKHQTQEGMEAGLRQLETEGGWAVLQALRESREIHAIGAGINHVGMIPRFLERFDMDYFLVAMPYTLLDQPALDAELQLCLDSKVSVVIGAVFASGILATGAVSGALYAYKAAEPEIVEKVQRMAAVCGRYGVPLAAAALQFPLGHPAVASVIPGANSAAQVHQNLEAMRVKIPSDFWEELKSESLLRQDAPVPAIRT